MPRDLTELVKQDAISNMSPLDRTQKSDSDAVQQPSKPQQGYTFAEMAHNTSKRDDLHPYTQTLTLSDVESCVILEEAAFPPQERATREKVSQPFPSLTLTHCCCRCLPHPTHCDIRVSHICCMRWPLSPSAVLLSTTSLKWHHTLLGNHT